MMYSLVYARTCRSQIHSLHPQLKPVVKKRIEELKSNPYKGKPLERELSGFYSYRARRFRIIYKIDPENKTVMIYHVGHRKDIYEMLAES
ncbi:MAG: type II toxin-antitoxin system RelE/ParE family toxin [Deltaproteobacteria bacterium]|nr:type II toxin-antitoxin system RelE/ParE family toxin [Deltaproteobacteria bacterium]MBW1817853.1 type II toxin-antitoxin system RelE/ParE family toxin [Deltaproteobacteria bacterium]